MPIRAKDLPSGIRHRQTQRSSPFPHVGKGLLLSWPAAGRPEDAGAGRAIHLPAYASAMSTVRLPASRQTREAAALHRKDKRMNRMAKGTAVIILAAALAGCTASPGTERDEETASPAPPSPTASAQETASALSPALAAESSRTLRALSDSVRGDGLEMHRGVGGAGGQEQTVQVEVPLDLGGLTVFGQCSGGEGTAIVSLNRQGPFELPCGGAGGREEIIPSLSLEGDSLQVTVDAPADSSWAVAVSSAP